jgi:plasmid stabilization system protein ParE
MKIVWSPTAMRHLAEIRRHIAVTIPRRQSKRLLRFEKPLRFSGNSRGWVALAGYLKRANS